MLKNTGLLFTWRNNVVTFVKRLTNKCYISVKLSIKGQLPYNDLKISLWTVLKIQFWRSWCSVHCDCHTLYCIITPIGNLNVANNKYMFVKFFDPLPLSSKKQKVQWQYIFDCIDDVTVFAIKVCLLKTAWLKICKKSVFILFWCIMLRATTCICNNDAIILFRIVGYSWQTSQTSGATHWRIVYTAIRVTFAISTFSFQMSSSITTPTPTIYKTGS